MAFLNYEVEGLSKKDNEELERQLKLLNKPAIKTIKMKPSFSLLKRDNESSTSNSSFKMGLKDGGCPMGTVPIRKTTKEDLIRERRFNASYARGTFHFALEQTSNGPRNQISGAGTTASMYNPKVLPNQWSASVVKVQNGRDQIQAGWRVDPILYGDTPTRFYSLFKDLKNGRWWLRYGPDFAQIGFWPPELFTGLKSFASQAAWGGEAFSSVPTFP
ncbi:protein neprosin-like [Nicotiana tabacum]|uniref:Protein neprosin-like n=1 Tax=Nicotiana tabacum TaxID=4097 RepID=A0AC58TXQ2_TOBAC